jgi:uncharacterized protein YdhG (YjbR/CyaY superfamily)
MATNLKEMEGMMTEMSAKMDANHKEMMAKICAETRSTICAFWPELKETIKHEMKAIIQPIRSELDEMTTCNGVTDLA